MWKGKLLIIDEDRKSRDDLQRLFISRSWEVVMVASQADGMSLLTEYQPDWIIVSWDQLEGIGTQFLSGISSGPKRPRVVLLMEPTMGRDDRTFVMRLKVDYRFRKPVDPEIVFRACVPEWTEAVVPLGWRAS
jgi:DNA-binding response OmpR family regulator